MKRKLLLIMLSLIFLTNAVKVQEPTDDTPIKIDTLLLTMPLVKAIDRASIADQSGSDVNRAVVQLVNNYFDSFKGRKAVIALSDGVTIRRDISTQQTLETLQKADILFYPIVFKTKFYAQARQRAANNNRKPLPMEMLEFLAKETTGRFYEKDASNLKEASENIAEELKYQYLLGFYPQNTNIDYLNKNVRITLDRKDLRIETKKRWQF